MCCNTSLSLIPFPHIDAFWRLCSRRLFENIIGNKRRNYTKRAISPFATMFSTFCHRLSIQLWRFSIIWQNMFKVVCCRIVVWGKGLLFVLQSPPLSWFNGNGSLYSRRLLKTKHNIVGKEGNALNSLTKLSKCFIFFLNLLFKSTFTVFILLI